MVEGREEQPGSEGGREDNHKGGREGRVKEVWQEVSFQEQRRERCEGGSKGSNEKEMDGRSNERGMKEEWTDGVMKEEWTDGVMKEE